jgi:hypothetical protein
MPEPLWFADEQVKYRSEHKLLGVTFTNKANFNQHAANIADKATTKMKQLSRLSYTGQAPKHLTLRAYKSFIRPALEYACQSWAANISKTSWNRLERTQRKALKIALRKPCRTATAFVYHTTKVQPIKERIVHLAEKYFIKHNRGIGPLPNHGLHQPAANILYTVLT